MSRSRRSRKRMRDGAEDEALRRSCDDSYTDECDEGADGFDEPGANIDLLPFIDPT